MRSDSLGDVSPAVYVHTCYGYMACNITQGDTTLTARVAWLWVTVCYATTRPGDGKPATTQLISWDPTL
jgi:hypothetical protein